MCCAFWTWTRMSLNADMTFSFFWECRWQEASSHTWSSCLTRSELAKPLPLVAAPQSIPHWPCLMLSLETLTAVDLSFSFWKQGLPCSLSWFGTNNSPASASWVLGDRSVSPWLIFSSACLLLSHISRIIVYIPKCVHVCMYVGVHMDHSFSHVCADRGQDYWTSPTTLHLLN